MLTKHLSLQNTKHLSITVVLWAIVMLILFPSCSKDEKFTGDAIIERDSLPAMVTYEIETFISDSGIVKYRITADEWSVFDRKRPSHWAFEKGMYMEQFDSLHTIEASIKADTAYYYDKQKLWKLMGNVDIQNHKGERFMTDLLYWNQSTQKVYSDRFIRIVQPDRTIEGHGFESNQQLTIYQINNISGIFYVDEKAQPQADETITSADSIN